MKSLYKINTHETLHFMSECFIYKAANKFNYIQDLDKRHCCPLLTISV
jgi:hypothetical protein